MCTLLFAFKANSKYDFIFLGNRDEYKNRPSLKAHFWKSNPAILAGMDLEKGGTWTGITKEGRIAFLTNYRDFSIKKTSQLSRGYLTQDFLMRSIGPQKYLQEIQLAHTEYNPFNLVVGTMKELWFYSNIEDQIRPINPGVFGLSNALLDTPWFKLNKAKTRFADLLCSDFTVNELFDILDDNEIPLDDELPRTGVPLETERMLSTIHIDTPDYGTVFKTVILVTAQGDAEFYEKSLNDHGGWDLTTYTFQCNMNKGLSI